MNIVVVSFFRNMQGRIKRYFDQVRALQLHARKADTDNTKNNIRVIAIEGDSTDKTVHELQQFKKSFYNVLNIEIVHYNHGKRIFSSTEDSDRLSALTEVMKVGMSQIDSSIDNIVLYVESDLVWNPHQVGTLIDFAYRRENNFDIFAPMVYAGDNFYDIFAFRKLNGERFTPFEHKIISKDEELIEVSSVGSCLTFRAELAELVNPIGEEGLVSWCRGAREIGYKIAVATGFRVDHPA